MTKEKLKIYHNPRCSKSRKALELISSQNIKLQIVKYLQSGILKKDLEDIFKITKFDINNFIRKKDQSFKDLKVDINELSTNQVIKLILENPVIIERPILIKYENDVLVDAIIGRPPELVLKLLD